MSRDENLIEVVHTHVWRSTAPDDKKATGVDARCRCGAWQKNGAIVEIVPLD